MALVDDITWGDILTVSSTKKMRIGCIWSVPTVTASTSSVKVTCKIYVQTKYSASDSNNTLSVSGSGDLDYSGAVSISTTDDSGTSEMESGMNIQLIKTLSDTFTPSHTSTTTLSISAKLSGVDAIPGTASLSDSVTLGRRPYTAPPAPSMSTSVSQQTAGDVFTLNFSSVGGADNIANRYDVSYRINDGAWIDWYTDTTSKSATTGAYFGLKWDFMARAGNQDAKSAYTYLYSRYSRPYAPTSVTASALTRSTVNIAYSATNYVCATSAYVYRKNVTTGVTELLTTTAGLTSYTDTTVGAGSWQYIVKYYGPGGFSNEVTSNTINIFTVSFMSDGNIYSSSTIISGSTAVAPATPTKANYDFLGWYIGETAYKFATVITSDKTLTAKWKAQAGTVELKANNGTSQSMILKTPATAPECPYSKDGYTFVGWAKTADYDPTNPPVTVYRDFYQTISECTLDEHGAAPATGMTETQKNIAVANIRNGVFCVCAVTGIAEGDVTNRYIILTPRDVVNTTATLRMKKVVDDFGTYYVPTWTYTGYSTYPSMYIYYNADANASDTMGHYTVDGTQSVYVIAKDGYDVRYLGSKAILGTTTWTSNGLVAPVTQDVSVYIDKTSTSIRPMDAVQLIDSATIDTTTRNKLLFAVSNNLFSTTANNDGTVTILVPLLSYLSYVDVPTSILFIINGSYGSSVYFSWYSYNNSTLMETAGTTAVITYRPDKTDVTIGYKLVNSASKLATFLNTDFYGENYGAYWDNAGITSNYIGDNVKYYQDLNKLYKTDDTIYSGVKELYSTWLADTQLYDITSGVIAPKTKWKGASFPSKYLKMPTTVGGQAYGKVGSFASAGLKKIEIPKFTPTLPSDFLTANMFSGCSFATKDSAKIRMPYTLTESALGISATSTLTAQDITSWRWTLTMVKDVDGVQTQLSTKEIQGGEVIGEIPSLVGDETYAFMGWHYASGTKVLATDICADADLTIYAKYQKRVSCTLSFNANGGSGSQDSLRDVRRVVIAKKNVYRDGYQFMGWNTKADGSGTTYNYGDEFLFENLDVILYASWKLVSDVYAFSVVDGGLSVYAKGDFNKVVEADLPSAYNGASVVRIGVRAFAEMNKLKTVGMPSTYASIGNEAFFSCVNLENILAIGVSEIGASAFEGCTKITMVAIPLCGNIPNKCFSGCTQLASVSTGVINSVGEYAFANTKISSFEIPFQCKSIGQNAFLNCGIENSGLIKIHHTTEWVGENYSGGSAYGSNIGACTLDFELPYIDPITWNSYDAYPVQQKTKQQVEKPLVFPPTPNKIGYDFDGWADEYGAKITESTLASFDSVYFYANFIEKPKFTVTYLDTANDEYLATQMVSNFAYPDVMPTNAGSSFYGWATVSEPGDKEYNEHGEQINDKYVSVGVVLSADITVYAIWKSASFGARSLPTSMKLGSIGKASFDIYTQGGTNWAAEILDTGELTSNGEYTAIARNSIQPIQNQWSNCSIEFTPQISGNWYGKYAYRRRIDFAPSHQHYAKNTAIMITDIDKDVLCNGNDFRVVYYDGATAKEIAHDYTNSGELWFKLQDELPEGVLAENNEVNGVYYGAYYIYYGLSGADAPKTSISSIFGNIAINDGKFEEPIVFGDKEGNVSFDYEFVDKKWSINEKQYIVDSEYVSIYLYEQRLYVTHHNDPIKNGCAYDLSSVGDKVRFVLCWSNRSNLGKRDYECWCGNLETETQTPYYEYNKLTALNNFYDDITYSEGDY